MTLDARTNDFHALPNEPARLQLLIDAAQDAYVAVDADGVITEWNHRAEVLYGWSREEIVGQRAANTIVAPSDRAGHAQRVGRLVAGQAGLKNDRTESVGRRKDGTEFPVEIVSWRLPDGGASVACAFIHDISGRMATEAALRESEGRLREAMELAGLGRWEWDVKAQTTTWSEQAFRNAGYEPGEVEPSLEAFLAHVHPDDIEAVQKVIWDPSKPIYDFEHRVLRSDGIIRWVLGTNELIFDDEGNLVRMYGATQDVTARKEAEASRAWLASVVSSSHDAMIGIDLAGGIVSWNRGAELLYGWSAEEAIGQQLSVLCPDERSEELSEIGEQLTSGVSVKDFETQRRRKDGSLVDVSISASPVLDETGRLIGASSIVRDVSEARRTRQALEHAYRQEREMVEKLQELDRVRGAFVSSVSHELRTPLTSILGYLELLESDGGFTEMQTDMLKTVDRNSRRLLALIEDILILSRIEAGTFETEREPVDVANVVDGALQVVKVNLEASRHRFTVEVDEDLRSVLGDHAELERVLVNLLSNAIKFTPPGGSLGLKATVSPGEVVIEVSDSGMGISPDDQDEMFTPFFRSAEAEREAIPGTGLGLSIVKTIVEQHGGSIACVSEPGHGTKMIVRLPTAASARIAS
ncbi:MAG: PAS domain S-box protein [Actinomycetota bacterium]